MIFYFKNINYNQTNRLKMSSYTVLYNSNITDLKETIKCYDLCSNPSGHGKSIPINRSNKMYLETPKMYLPFGVSEYNNKYSLSLSFKNNNDDDKITRFEKLISDFDEHVIEQIINNDEWLSCLNVNKKIKDKDILKTVVEGFYSSNLKTTEKTDANGNKYPSMLKVKLPCYNDGNFSTTMWTNKGNPTEKLTIENVHERIPKGSYIRVLFQIQKVWFSAGTKCGVTFNAVQMKVYPPKKQQNECLMIDDGSDDE